MTAVGPNDALNLCSAHDGGFAGMRSDFWRNALDLRRGQRIAMTDGATGLQLTYSDFGIAAGRLALSILHALGNIHDASSVIAVCRRRGPGMLVCMWATQLAGGVYLPLPPCLPLDRKHFILESTKARVLLTEPSLAKSCVIPHGVLVFSFNGHNVAGGPNSSPLPSSIFEIYHTLEAILQPTVPTDFAYFIHTSGSTGLPKCVMHDHGSVDWHTHMTLIGSGLCTAEDCVLQVADCSFDLHVRDVFCTMSFGGQVVTVSEEALRNLDEFTALFKRHRVTWVETLPSVFSAAVNFLEISELWSRLASLRIWSCIGAPYQLAPARRAHRHLPHLQFFNSYAPTENCFVTTCHRLTPTELNNGDRLYRVPIGRPVPGWICLLLNEESAHLEVITHLGHAGCSPSGILYVRGPGVFQGYLDRSDLTEAAMVSHPCGPLPLFRTGDVCHYDQEGRLVYEGRRDLQVKVHGQRLELGEIESIVSLHPAVSLALVRLIQPDPDNQEYDFLAVYLTLTEGKGRRPGDVRFVPCSDGSMGRSATLWMLDPVLEQEIQSLCRQHMTDATTPRVFLECPDVPKTATGKPDRRSLPVPPEGMLLAIAERSRNSSVRKEELPAAGALVETTDEGERLEMQATLEALLFSIPGLKPPVDSAAPLDRLGLDFWQLKQFVDLIQQVLLPSLCLGELFLMPNLSVSSLASHLQKQRSLAAKTEGKDGGNLHIHDVLAEESNAAHSKIGSAVSSLSALSFTASRLLVGLGLLMGLCTSVICIEKAWHWSFLDAIADATTFSIVRSAARFAWVVLLLPAAILLVGALRRFLFARHLRRLLQHQRVFRFPLYSWLHVQLIAAQQLTTCCLWLFGWCQGSELYNCLLRLLGARVAAGSIVFGTVDFPELLCIERDCIVAQGTIIQCLSYSSAKAGGDHVMALGAVHLQHHTAVGQQCSLVGGCILLPFTEVRFGTHVSAQNDAALPNCEETNWRHGASLLLLTVQSFLLAGGVLCGMLLTVSSMGMGWLFLQRLQHPAHAALAAVVLLDVGRHLASALLFAIFHRSLGCPVMEEGVRTVWLVNGSWAFFRHVILRNAVLHLFAAPLVTFQSCGLPALLLRLSGMKVGRDTVLLLEDPSKQFGVPLQLVTLGANVFVATDVCLGAATCHFGRWGVGALTIEDRVHLAERCVVDSLTEGLTVPQALQVCPLADVTKESVAGLRDGHVLLGTPARPTLLPWLIGQCSGTTLPGSMLVIWAIIVHYCERFLFPTPLDLVFICAAMRESMANDLWDGAWACPSSTCAVIVVLFLAWATGVLWLCSQFVQTWFLHPGARFELLSWRWAVMQAFNQLCGVYFSAVQPFLSCSPLYTMLHSVAGGRLHSSALIAGAHLRNIPLLSGGCGSFIADHADVLTVVPLGQEVELRAATLGTRCCLLGGSILMPGVTLQDDVVVRPRSLIVALESLPSNTCWAGVPATSCHVSSLPCKSSANR
eukprot:GGOE01004144.1.p1 GENE.GGOE01004144.1~~GGOE01004144.1.p1  ORF type:complete len:1545 (-),score=302.20 GGOE01004144.1:408-4817(-)